MAKKPGRKSRSGKKSSSKALTKKDQPQNTAMEDIAEEMINGIFCHYEPPDEATRHKGILRKPRSRRAHSDSSLAGSDRRRVRWSDIPESDAPDEAPADSMPFAMQCITGAVCNDEAVRAGMEKAEKDSAADYDLVQSFSEDSNGVVRRRESRVHHDVIFDEDGNPVPAKPGAHVDLPPPPPPPKKKETFIPELCGVKIWTEDDEHTFAEEEQSEKAENPNAPPSLEKQDSDGYDRPDHSRYRPSWEYTDDEENSLLDGGRAKKDSLPAQTTPDSVFMAEGDQSVPPPPPPPPPPATVPKETVQSSGAETDLSSLKETTDEKDWDEQEPSRSNCAMLGPTADDWDQSFTVIPSALQNKFKSRHLQDPPLLDAPDSRDSQEENKPQRGVLYSPMASEAGTELTWNEQTSRRRPFFRRGRSRDKRQSMPGRVEVLEDDKRSQASGASQKSFLGFRSRSKSPGRRRMFGRTRSGSDVNSGYESALEEDVEKQSFIGAYRDSINNTDPQTNLAVTGFHPAHPLSQGFRKMSRDDVMERQSFITAYRESMDPENSKVQSITERLRRLRAHRMANDGNGPVDLDEVMDDEAFERQSMITAHREAFEGKNDQQTSLAHRRMSDGGRTVGENKGKETDGSWEKRTRAALERIRCGTDASSLALEQIRCDTEAPNHESTVSEEKKDKQSEGATETEAKQKSDTQDRESKKPGTPGQGSEQNEEEEMNSLLDEEILLQPLRK